MTRKVYRSPAFCLHSRPYRETSAILQLFTRDAGRISVVAKGIKSANKRHQNLSAAIQPFAPLQVEWLGAGELKTLSAIEPDGPAFFLEGKLLFAGLYLNELLNILLPEQQEYSELYHAYSECLMHFADGDRLEENLRCLERFLLEQLGYGIAFFAVDENGQYAGNLSSTEWYIYKPESGFLKCHSTYSESQNDMRFWGGHLCKIAVNEYTSPEILFTAKQLMRQTFNRLLGGRTLHSRSLFF